MTKTFVRGPGRVVARILQDDGQYVTLTWDDADMVVDNRWDGGVTLHLRQAKGLKPVATDAIRLADAVYAGDETAALALADEVQLQRTSGSEYVHRDELLAVLRQVEWGDSNDSGFGYQPACPACHIVQNVRLAHRKGCRLGKALGRICDVTDESEDYADSAGWTNPSSFDYE